MSSYLVIGLQPCGKFKYTKVDNLELRDYIKNYKRKYRIRAIIIDGICVYEGNVDKGIIDGFIKNVLPKINLQKE